MTGRALRVLRAARAVRAAFLACLAASGCASGQAARAGDPPLRARVDSLAHAAGLVGSVVVTRGSETLLAAGYGLADRERGIPNTASTKHRIGSITKQFTGMAVLLLQDRGKLRVTDRVADHLDDVPDAWRDLTIHQLLTHTSGLMHSWALPGFAERAARPITLDETLALFHDRPLLYAPGDGFTYSGVGYFLLARIIEEASGSSYDAFLRASVLEPLAMRSTGGDRPDVALNERAMGYVRGDDGELRDAPPLFAPILTGGGHLYSTAEDLARWDRALARRALLSEAGYAAFYRPDRESYAYGWRVAPFRGRPAIAHSGGVPGFNAHILRLPEDDVAVVVLTNVTPGQARPVAEAIAAMVLGEGAER